MEQFKDERDVIDYIRNCKKAVEHLVNSPFVDCETAFYGFIRCAAVSLELAIPHSDECKIRSIADDEE